MSTLGDLLAEHTDAARQRRRPPARRGGRMATAGRPLVRRLPDVGAPRRRRAGVCGQCRPNTAPTVLLADAVGTLARGARKAVGLRGVQVAARSAGKAKSDKRIRPQTATFRSRRCPSAATTTSWRCSPTRPRSPRARPARWNAPTSTARATCCTCCRRAPFPTSATCRSRGPARASATASSGWMSTGAVVFASPNALSAYHRMGLNAELEGQNLVARDQAADLRPVRGAGAGRPRA